MTFHENWFPEDAQRRTLNALRRAPLATGAAIEVGCWEGRSTCLIANAIYPRLLHAVDWFKGDAQGASTIPGQMRVGPVAAIAKKRDVRAVFESNVAELTQGNVVLHCMDWREFFASWNDPIAFLHIDGAHDYWSVHDNITEALPLLVPGAVLVGDDWLVSPTRKAVLDVLKKVEAKGKTWWWTKT